MNNYVSTTSFSISLKLIICYTSYIAFYIIESTVITTSSGENIFALALG